MEGWEADGGLVEFPDGTVTEGHAGELPQQWGVKMAGWPDCWMRG